MRNRKGFSLIELAIVLVIIGIIIGMAFKGKQLIDGAKVKKLATQYDKYNAAINIFYERYNRIPGDGCNVANPTTAICAGTPNGLIDSDNEAAAFFVHLVDITGILAETDKTSAIGMDWTITTSNPNYLQLANPDAKFACALDQMIDDGVNSTGFVQTDLGADDTYTATTDCWTTLDDVTATTLRLRANP